jgi:hypothetical protein
MKNEAVFEKNKNISSFTSDKKIDEGLSWGSIKIC